MELDKYVIQLFFRIVISVTFDFLFMRYAARYFETNNA